MKQENSELTPNKSLSKRSLLAHKASIKEVLVNNPWETRSSHILQNNFIFLSTPLQSRIIGEKNWSTIKYHYACFQHELSHIEQCINKYRQRSATFILTSH